MTKITLKEEDKNAAKLFELRSEELRDILGQVPKWVVRYGTVIIFGVIAILIICAALLKYPDVINSRIILTTERPPAELTSNISARIGQFLVSDNETVKAHQVLLVFESAADYMDVLKLKGILGTTYSIDTILQNNFSEDLTLGEIQESYAGFLKKLQEYKSFISLNYYNRKINSIKSELDKYSSYNNRLNEQEEVLRKEYQLAEKQYNRDSMLFINQVLSRSQLENSETDKLKKLFDWKQTRTNLASTQIEVSKLHQDILEMELKLEESSHVNAQDLREAFEKLNGQISLWEKRNLIESPFEGQVSFTKFWSENQRVQEGEIVMTVIPKDQGKIIGKIEISANGIGKVSEGHRVLIRFDNYPYLEFGAVYGKITAISLVPNKEQYSAEVKLDSTRLITNYNRILDFRQNMPGTAEIITENRTLLGRIFAPIKSAIRKQSGYKSAN
jgi:multidrug resistance efflux pump